MAEIFFRLLWLEIQPGQSAFLWGARKTGQSTLLRSAFGPAAKRCGRRCHRIAAPSHLPRESGHSGPSPAAGSRGGLRRDRAERELPAQEKAGRHPEALHRHEHERQAIASLGVMHGPGKRDQAQRRVQGDARQARATCFLYIEHGPAAMAPALTTPLNHAMQIERAQALKAESHQRTGDRRGYANGFKPKTLETRVGQVALRIPRPVATATRTGARSILSRSSGASAANGR